MILTVAGKEKATEASEVLTALAADAETTEAVRPADTADDAPMTEADFQALDDLEAGVKGCWWRMGRFFAEIKTRKLYRQRRDGTRQTWEEYCKTAHGLTKQRVDTIIRAAEVREALKTETKVSVLPETVSQAAELAGLETEEMAAAAVEAVNTAVARNRSPTANDYRQAAAKFRPKATGRRVANSGEARGGSGLATPVNDERRPSQTSPALPPNAKLHEFEVEVRIGFKLSVPDHVTAEAVAEAIRHGERWAVDLSLPFGYELAEKAVRVGHVRPWDGAE